MTDDEITDAITSAAIGNMETYNDCDGYNTGITLDASAFLADLRSAGWTIVPVAS